MRIAVDSVQMKQIEKETIEGAGLPSLVLMERAALALTAAVQKKAEKLQTVCPVRIGIICGNGNNGGDGVACARHLFLAGYDVKVLLVCQPNGEITKEQLEQMRMTEELRMQLQTALWIGVPIFGGCVTKDYDIIVDAVFGIGLHREITGELATMICRLNEEKHWVIAADIPSGIAAGDGKVLGVAVRADETIAFGFMKRGLLLYPGASYAGKITIEEAGILRGTYPVHVTYYKRDDLPELLPKREKYSNKGTFGKVFMLAGAENMSGAAYFSAMAAYRMGAGMVRLATAAENRLILQSTLPEALLTTYEKNASDEEIDRIVQAAEVFADVLVAGPGLSQGTIQEILLWRFLELAKDKNIPCVLDADALNILAKKLDAEQERGVFGENPEEIPKKRMERLGAWLPKNTVLTPHLGELRRLLALPVKKIAESLLDAADICTYNNEIVVVMKDARTIVAQGDRRYINVAGNEGMATAGSGDVLTGIIAALMAAGKEPFEAACAGCFVHGLAGDAATEKLGSASVMAGSLLEMLPDVLYQNVYPG